MKRFYRKIIYISAEDSPNVQLGLAERDAGLPISNHELIPGVISYSEYLNRLATWDEVRIHIGLRGKFWKGGETLLFPPTWLDRANRLAIYLKGTPRIARGMGIDPGEGVANTSISVVDEYGLIELVSEKTSDTSRVTDMCMEMIFKHNLAPEQVYMDRGGGGHQHADRLRKHGVNVMTIGFNDKPTIAPQRHKVRFSQRTDIVERRYAYFNVRAEMYGELRNLLDYTAYDDKTSDRFKLAWLEVSDNKKRAISEIKGFAIPSEYTRLRSELAPIPLKFELEKLKLPPKYKRNPLSKEQTLTSIIGHSPDDADSLVLAIHAMLHGGMRVTAEIG